MKKLILAASLALFAASSGARAEGFTYASLEGALIWQTRNDQAIPGVGGTRFSLSDPDTGPFGTYRVYVGHRWNKKHEIRALYAPFSLDLNASFANPIDFMGSTFAADTLTSAFYKFNSYRLTYTYFFDPVGGWDLGLGFTAKIRDAEVRLEQSGVSRSKKNVGFVPLLNFRASRALFTEWLFRFDLDGLAAPQGRAFDAAFFLERKITGTRFSAFGGYRTLEGGASNDEVYSFAWLHYLTLGVRGEF
jgi:hypothetical protein